MPNNSNREIRTVPEAPQMEERALENGETAHVISGYAIRFGVESQVLPSWEGNFIEIIDRSAVTPELLAQSDVVLTFNHKQDQLIARSTNGKGTLSLTLDNKGLRYEAEVPNVSYARDLFEHIRLGNVRGSSFCFACYSPGSVEYTRKADGTRLRTIKKIDELYDVSAVVTPAYTQTSVEARSWEAQRQVLEEQPQQEQRFGMLPEEGEMALMK
jgi:hypothetical protein